MRQTAVESSRERRLFIHTFGCQMNESDSDRIAERLAREGFRRTPVADDADLIFLNTCAIRDKSEQKVLSALGRYRRFKVERGALIGVGGCVAQLEKQKLFRRAPYLDFVVGPDAIPRLPDVLRRVTLKRESVLDTQWVETEAYVFPRADPEAMRGRVTAFVTAMKGCDNVCSFCVVPRTRGREVSRPVDQVLAEVQDLATAGVREVTLIGQNVNSYRGGCDFADLLRRVCAVAGIWRVRFTTSHPNDLSDRLIAAVGELPSLCPHFHLPVQSGSDAVLVRMRRDYTVAAYRARLDALRRARPGIAVSTDIIVGFPGETEADFECTLDLVDAARYENIYAFAFSPRPHTAAGMREAEWGRVPHEVVVGRLERLLAQARAIALECLLPLVGRTVEVLVEGPSKTDPMRRFGRTDHNRVVNFDGDAPAGTLAWVRLDAASPNACSGTQVAAKAGVA